MIRRWGLITVLAVALLAATPLQAAAHSDLIDSQPAAGARLGLAPAAVALAFSEPVYPALSEAVVTDPSGRTVTAHPSSAFEIRAPLLTNLPGVYRVAWKAVSATDGHTTAGSFTFTVEAALSAAGTNAPGRLTALDVLIAVGRWIEDGALLIALGMLLLGLLARRPTPLEWVRPHLLAPLLAALIAGVVVVGGEAIAAGVDAGHAPAYFTSAPEGLARVARVLFEALACGAVVTRVRLLLTAVPLALGALSASGHAIGTQPAWWGVILDTGHLVAAGIWVGGIIALATLRPPDGWRGAGRVLLARFTPWALAGFATSAGLGALQAIANLGDVPALWTTAYGRVLIAKAVAIAAIVPLSFVAWQRRRTHLRVEAAAGLVAVAAAALLASFPVPSRTTLATGLTVTAAVAGLPHGDDLTLGAEAGQSLVGLTVAPALPGANTLTVYVNTGGATDAASLDITALVEGRAVPLRGCGPMCRVAGVELWGNDDVTVHVAGSLGGTAGFRLPALPAPNASALLATAEARMAALHSVALHETLTGGAGTTIITDYREVAPDLLEWAQPDGSATIVLGAIRYTRSQVNGGWTIEPGNPTVSEPAFSWGLFAPDIAVHVLGSARVGTVPTTEVAFFAGAAATPVWFRFYVDAAGLVRRADMTAPGHFMVQTFSAFDSPMSIAQPEH